MESFSKAERLSSRIHIGQLMTRGKSFNHAPFRITWMEVPRTAAPVQVLVSAPKRIWKRSVDRNRIKRLIREAYRRNKSILLNNAREGTVQLTIVYTSPRMIDYKEMEEKISAMLERLVKVIRQKNEVDNSAS
jgi:ribonuclease P protein component